MRGPCKNAHMDWDDLRFVLAIHREGTLARAATRLGVTHTTVGRRLKGLEGGLGVRLFDRTPDGFVPTPAGHDLCEVAAQIEGDVLSAEGRVAGQDVELAGPLRVSTMDLFFCGMPDIFATFVARYPSIDLTVTASTERVSLPRREADVALRLTNEPPEYLVGRKVGRVEFAVYAAEHLIAEVGEGTPLDGYPWLGWDDPAGDRWLRSWQADHAPGARTVLRIDENGWVRQRAVVAGVGVFFMACFEGDALPGVRRISEIQRPFGHDVWLLTLRELRNTSRIRAFMDHVTDAFAARSAALAGDGPSEGSGHRAQTGFEDDPGHAG